MRWFVSLVLALALGVMGCSEGGGSGGMAGTGGMGGDGGTGGTDLCEGIDCDDGKWCTDDVCNPADGMCVYSNFPEGVFCLDGGLEGFCDGAGNCIECDADRDCDDLNDCTVESCEAGGKCSDHTVPDGTQCAGGTCQDGICELMGTILPCTEQGIRNAIAAGGGPYTFDCDGPTTVVTEAPIKIDNDVKLDGGGNLIVDGNGSHLVLSVGSSVDVELHGFTVTGGSTGSDAAGIVNSGALTLRNSTVSGNVGWNGGGIANISRLIISNSTVNGNECGYIGCGAGINNGGDMTMINSTVSERSISIGVAVFNGSGSLSEGTTTIINSTVTAPPGDETWGIENHGWVTLATANTIVEGGCRFTPFQGEPPGPDPRLLSDGGNIESLGDTCGFDQPTDQVNISADDLALGPLQDNGGPTETHALGAGSVAIDQILEADCVDADGAPLTTDQRGVTRPQGDSCDVGAFELEVGP